MWSRRVIFHSQSFHLMFVLELGKDSLRIDGKGIRNQLFIIHKEVRVKLL